MHHVAATLRAGPPRPALERLLDPIPIYRIPEFVPEAIDEGSPEAAEDAAEPAEDAARAAALRSPSRVRFDAQEASATTPMDVDSSAPSSTTQHGGPQSDAEKLAALRAEFGGNPLAAGPRGKLKASFSFSAPAQNYENVAVQQLSKEEKGETGAAIGMKARLQLYMERQRVGSA